MNEPIVYTHNTTDYETAKKFLQDSNIAFFTYTPQNKNKKILILKGLNCEYSADEIKKELVSPNIKETKIEKVDKFIYNKNTPEKYHYIVQLSPESKVTNITAIKKVAFQLIRWEPYRKNKVFQCFNAKELGTQLLTVTWGSGALNALASMNPASVHATRKTKQTSTKVCKLQ